MVEDLSSSYHKQVKTIGGLSAATRATHWFPRLFWLTLSILISAICMYSMLDAWNDFARHDVITQTSVGYSLFLNRPIKLNFLEIFAV